MVRQNGRPPADRGASRDAQPLHHLSLHVDCAVAMTIVFGQLLALGANNSLFATAFSEFCLLAAGVRLWMGRNEAGMERLWSAALLPLALLFLAVLWALAPLVAPGLAPARLTPDAFAVELLKLAGLGALILLGAKIGKAPRGLRVATLWLLCLGAAYLLISLWLWRENGTEVWGQIKGRHLHRFTATLLNANAAACVCAMVTLLGLAKLYASLAPGRPRMADDWVEAAVAGAAILLGAFAIFLTASRASGVALGGAALVQALVTRGRGGRGRGGGWPRLLIVLGLGGAAIVGAVMLDGAATLDRPFNSEDAHVRLAGYRIYWDLLQQQPLFGYGLGAFRQLNQAHIGTPDADLLWDMGAAHQPILQAALEGGAPYALLLCAAVFVLAGPAVLRLLRPGSGQVLAVGVALSSILIFAVAQVDLALNVPAIASLALLLLGLVWGWSLSIETARTRKPTVGHDS